MEKNEYEYPHGEEFPSPGEESGAPPGRAEYQEPDGSAEFPGSEHEDFVQPHPDREFTPPGKGGTAVSLKNRKRRRLRKILFSAAALALTVLLFRQTGSLHTVRDKEEGPRDSTAEPAETGELTENLSPKENVSPAGTLAAEPSPSAEAPVYEPAIRVNFFAFSSEHHALIEMEHTDFTRSVTLVLHDRTLDEAVWSGELSAEEIVSGVYEMPAVDPSEYYLNHWDEFEASGKWPEFELILEAVYEDENGTEQTVSLRRGAVEETGYGFTYWRDDETPSAFFTVYPGCFVVSPWEETESVQYFVDDPDAVTGPDIVSVSLSSGGNSITMENVQITDEISEFTGEVTKVLVIPRPDWMPAEGTVHVTITWWLNSVKKCWTKEMDYAYPAY